MHKLLFLIILIVLFSGCKSVEEPPKEETIPMPTPLIENRFASDDAKVEQSQYLHDAKIQEYQLGRRVDKKDNILKEASPVYRVERLPSWNTTPLKYGDPTDTNSLIGQVNRAVIVSNKTQAEFDDIKKSMVMLHKAFNELNAQQTKTDENIQILIDNMKLLKKYVEKLEQQQENNNHE